MTRTDVYLPAEAAPVADAPGRPRRFWRAGKDYAAALGFVALAWALAAALDRMYGLERLSPIFLAAVLLAAVTSGMRAALLAAVVAFGIYNFYIVEPRFSFSLDSPEEYLTLALFLTAALLTGGLAGRVRDEGIRATARARTLAALLEASREFSATDQEDALRARLSEQLAAAAKGEGEVAYNGHTWRSAAATVPASTPWVARAMVADGVALGEARWRSADPPPSAGQEVQSLVQVLVDMGAAALARSRLASVKAQVESIARTDRLRTALLASVSHDFRTPLTAILASASSLRTFRDQFEPRVQEDLLSTIQEEAERLNGHVANLLSFTKLESGALDVDLGSVSVPEVLGALLRRYRPRTGSRLLALSAPDQRLEAIGDPFLLEQALSNVLENAIRYGPTASTIELRARRSGKTVAIEILDEGPGVADEEKARIFEKFYRASDQLHTQGTGLGLSIAKGMVEAMGGAIAARDRPDGGEGLMVSITLQSAERHEV